MVSDLDCPKNSYLYEGMSKLTLRAAGKLIPLAIRLMGDLIRHFYGAHRIGVGHVS